MTAMARCDRCGEVAAKWMHLEPDRWVSGICMATFRDPSGFDLCISCADLFAQFVKDGRP